MNIKQDIRDVELNKLEEFCFEQNLQKFRSKQIWEWLWKKRAVSFDEMTSLPVELRDLLDKNFYINPVSINKKESSRDGTVKFSLKLYDKHQIEGVLIPSKNRITACVSSQVGCSLSCNFCATGTLKLKRNLSASEIYDQVYILNQQAKLIYEKPLSNIVFMGMGEPLHNYKNLLRSIYFITNKSGLSMSHKRITVSTVGIAKMIKKLGDDKVRFNLAISLHSAHDKQRTSLMPINEKINLKELRESILYFYSKTGTRVTYEYILFKGINDSIEDAKLLSQFAKSIPCKINLIEYNTVDELPYQKSSVADTEKFIFYLEEKNIITNLRKSRGKDINAACGQLVNKLS